MPTDPRPLRLCDVCGQLDDHPRHVTGLPADSTEGTPTKEFLDSLAPGAPVSAIAELLNPTTVVRHIDCCAAAGCPAEGDDHCAVKDQEYGGRRGQQLIDHLEQVRV